MSCFRSVHGTVQTSVLWVPCVLLDVAGLLVLVAGLRVVFVAGLCVVLIGLGAIVDIWREESDGVARRGVLRATDGSGASPELILGMVGSVLGAICSSFAATGFKRGLEQAEYQPNSDIVSQRGVW